MKDYKFKLVRELDLIIPAMSEQEAWIEITKVDPELIADGWQITLINSNESEALSPTAPAQADSTFDEFEGFEDYSFLNPSGPATLG